MDFIFFDSGLSETIRFSLLKRLENKALYPLTPSPDVTLPVGSDKIFISFNKNKDLGIGNNSQQWSKPQLVFQKPGYILWYPSLQPLDTEEDIKERRTSLKLGKRARFFVKRIKPGDDEYASEHIIEFEK